MCYLLFILFYSASNIYATNVKFPYNKVPQLFSKISTIESVLEGHQESVSSSSLPTTLLTANYDSFSFVRSLSLGSLQADGASNTFTFLKILRMFRALYDDQQTADR